MNILIQYILLTTLLISTSCTAQSERAKKIILDTDIAGDYDDVGAMAVLHYLADKGEAEILSVISCNAFPTTVPTIDLLNRYFNKPNIPVGVTKSDTPYMDCPQKWAEYILEKYPVAEMTNESAPDAVSLYRKILAAQPDNSVTIITIGFFTNIANLITSLPDEHSELSGKDLVKKKVSQLVSMGASIEKGKDRGREYNVHIDTRSSKIVFEQWPTPVILSGLEIGKRILTGIPLINNTSISDSPVQDAYRVALEKDRNTKGRMSWDQTAVLVGVRGIEPYFKSRKINLEILDDGTNVLIPGERFTYLEFAMTPKELSAIIEEMMMHRPQKKSGNRE